MAISQDAQQGKLTTPLGKDVLGLTRFSAIEGLSELFEIRVEAISEQAGLDFSSTLGLGATIELETQDDQTRYFNGLDDRGALGRDARGPLSLPVGPAALALVPDPDVGLQDLRPDDADRDHQAGVFRPRLLRLRDATTGSPPTLEYCVQYRETDFNFVCRLMEQFGVYYFFEHADGKHTLVLADAKSSHSPGAGTRHRRLQSDRRRRAARDAVSRGLVARAAGAERRLRPGRLRLQEAVHQPRGARRKAPGDMRHDSMEMFDYPYAYVDTEGNNFVRTRASATIWRNTGSRRRSRSTSAGSSMGSAPSLFPGALVTLQKHPEAARTRSTSSPTATHRLMRPSFRSGGATMPRLCRQLRVHAERPAVPRAARHPQARDRRRPVRARHQARTAARRSTSTSTGGSSSSSIGTGRASRRAASASPRSGPGRTAARCSRLASATRS